MCQEVFEIVQKMDLSDVEVRLALQCAPLITKIKISNLLTVSSKESDRIHAILAGTEIESYCLYRQREQSIYFLYDRSELEKCLQEISIKQALAGYGYPNVEIAGILECLCKRYAAFRNGEGNFPHEMGILLGYPIEDVEGFVKNEGENYLYAGYWKVYKDVEDKKLLFDSYECAKEGLMLLVGHGYSIRAIIEYIQRNGIC